MSDLQSVLRDLNVVADALRGGDYPPPLGEQAAKLVALVDSLTIMACAHPDLDKHASAELRREIAEVAAAVAAYVDIRIDREGPS